MLKCYSIFDDKAQYFNVPFFSASEGIALRDFGDLCNDSRSVVSRHPEDYHLYCLAEFDDDKGLFTSLPQPVFVAHALSMLHLRPGQPLNDDDTAVEPVQPGGTDDMPSQS